jgi:hypothetical protein
MNQVAAMRLIWDKYRSELEQHPSIISQHRFAIALAIELGDVCLAIHGAKDCLVQQELAHLGAVVLRALVELFPD